MKRSCPSPSPIPSKSQPDVDEPNEVPLKDDISNENKVFNEFRRIESELKLGVNTFERNNSNLSIVLNNLRQEVKFLREKKELQKTALIRLQISVEKIDRSKQSAQDDCRLERDRHADLIKSRLKQVVDNDKYLVETRDKIKQILSKDKVTVDNFLEEIRQYGLHQTKSCVDLKNEILSARDLYYNKIDQVQKEENRIDGELDSFVARYKNCRTINEKFEYELNEKCTNLTILQKEATELKMKVQLCKERLKETVELNVRQSEKLSNYVDMYKEELNLWCNQNDEMKKNLQTKNLELKENEKKLNDAIQERQFLLNETQIVRDDVRKLNDEIEMLTQQNEQLRRQINDKTLETKDVERSIVEIEKLGIEKRKESADKKNLLTSKMSDKIDEFQNVEKQLASLSCKKSQIRSQFDAIKLKNDECKNMIDASEKQLSDLLSNLNHVDSNVELDSKIDELKELNDKRRSFEQQIESVAAESKSVDEEIVRLEERNAALNRELEHVQANEITESSFFQEEKKRLSNLKKEIVALKEEVRLSKIERNGNVGLLEGEIEKVELELKRMNEDFETKKKTIENSYQETEIKLNHLEENMRKQFNDEMRIKRVQINHLSSNLPQIKGEIARCKNDLTTMIDRTTLKMKERLKCFKQMVRRYKNMYNSVHSVSRSNLTSVRIMGIIEEHLKPAMRGMMEYLGMSLTELATPTPDTYSNTLNNFELRFDTIVSEANLQNMNPSLLEEFKLLGCCLFGIQRTDTLKTVGVPVETPFFSPSSSIN